ncbi:TonB-dependent receptor [uncultured Paraglaciecola sp.]|uniref:TonB-dependent receptor n=1 Tax=uncultured Paraglaciecola sp. TaxID=1765024 RepID=UPI0025945F82|nr:TonB-dependent receptor [uncultured Paraglaciecola sp.]
MTKLRKTALAVSIAFSVGISFSSFAGNNDGDIRVSITDTAQSPLTGTTVTITNTKTGYTKQILVDSDGKVRLSGLPVGLYKVEATKAGYNSSSAGSIAVTLGQETTVKLALSTDDLEKIEVTGSVISPIDVTSSESALNISATELARIPVPRSITSVALLAPGTNSGDSAFGGVSFGGSSVAENQMFINGLNVTNFRNGLGFSSVPYDFYDQFQVKTGGYSAEFGRSTGGVINAVTKSGGNEFEFGANVYWLPGDLRAQSPNVASNNGDYYKVYNGNDEYSKVNANLYASGPIIKDTLFFYAMYSPEKYEQEYSSRGTSYYDYEASENNDFWGLKLDWNINDDHRLEFLTFSDSSKTITDNYNVDDDGETQTYASTAYEKTGGTNWSLKYSGYLTDTLTLSALYGVNKYDVTEGSNVSDDCELIYDYRYYYYEVYNAPYYNYSNGCATSNDYSVESGNDKRQAMRVDLEWEINDSHVLKLGLDNEINTSNSTQYYSGPNGAYWLAYAAEAGSTINSVLLEENTDYIRSRVRTVGGSFETESSSFYIEDTWTVTDNLTATIGLRSDVFDNKNAEGDSFVKIDDMIAPRLGLSWDINGNGESKIFANVGRYFLPVANNTNVRLAGNESDIREYYVLEDWTEYEYNSGTYYNPVLGEQIGDADVIADGTVPDTRSVVDANIEAMYQDELILGYESLLNLYDDNWSYGVKFTYRSLNGAIDDMIIDHAIADKFGCGDDYHAYQYVLGNPGKSMEVYTDTDCDYENDAWATFTPEELEYDEAIRKYLAWDFSIGRKWDGHWSLNATYTWSHSYGNTEGLVKSDNGQDDAGLTTDFDFPELMDGAYGNLPNDRRHSLKVYGAYALSEDLTLGFNYSLSSGRPINYFGTSHPNTEPEDVEYGYTYYEAINTGETLEDGSIDYDYIRHARGTMGTTSSVSRLDLNLTYTTEFAGLDTVLKLDVFNILNADSETEVDETAETTIATYDADYLLPTSFQTPRYVQLSARFAY